MAAAALLGTLCAPALPGSSEDEAQGLVWNERTAEHLINRAGFGGDGVLVSRLARRTPEDVVNWLLNKSVEKEPFDPELILYLDAEKEAELSLEPDEARAMRAKLKVTDNTQYMNYCEDWYRSMVDGRQPLHDRMTLFWHGFFPTSTVVVRRKYEVIRQHQLLEKNALGNFEDLLRGITHDPAMLWFLDNDANVKGHPNENLGRELMELFSLGEGNYTEVDVREAARALTGVSSDRDTGHWVFNKEDYDAGEKTILGVKGDLNSNALVDILLDQEACARWVSYKVISYFEGIDPDSERLDSYAKFLRENEYEIKPMLRRLFLDPEFYRSEAISSRVQSPVDFFVGAIRRLGIEDMPQWFVFTAVRNLGQGIYYPPSVEGWKEGESWITNDSLMQRGNYAGGLLGLFTSDYSPGQASDGDMKDRRMQAVLEAAMTTAVRKLNQDLRIGSDWRPRTKLSERIASQGVATDEELVGFLLEELLAIKTPTETKRVLMEHVGKLRSDLGLEDNRPLLQQEIDQDLLLRHLAHVILSLPEAQLG